jgi:hypothetical protein
MKSCRTLLILSVALAACSDVTVPAPELTRVNGSLQSITTPEGELVAGQIIVRYRPGAARSEIAEAHRAHKKDDLLLERTELLEVPVGEEVAIAAQMSNDPNVEIAEPDWITRVGPCETSVSCDLPDGSLVPYRWDHYNTGSFIVPGSVPALTVATTQPDADIDFAEMYDHLGPTFGGSAVLGILDTGIRPTHPMVVGKILGGKRFIVDAQPSTNFTDDHGHGTHVAGIAAGSAGAPITGVAFGSNMKLLIAKVCNSAGQCPVSSTINGIVWLSDNGANVLNLSLGSFGGDPDITVPTTYQAAFQYAASKNILPICATGNDDGKANYFGGVGYPARFPECMAVGATDWGDTKASYSNYGPQIEVSAPGGDGERSPYSLILSAHHTSDGAYAFRAGTSMATPQVAGLATVLFATGMTSADAVRQRIRATADDIEAPGFDNRTGSGRINAYRAVTGIDPNAAPVANAGGPYSGLRNFAIQFDGSSSFDPNMKPVSYEWNFGDPGSASNTSTSASPSHTYMAAGVYSASLTVTDAAGLTHSATAAVTVWTPAEGIQNLILNVLGQGGTSGLGDGILRSLEAKLQAAQQSLGNANDIAAASQLRAFDNEVTALMRSGRITSAAADQLTALANMILQSM